MIPIPREGIRTFLAECTGLAVSTVVWEDEEEPAIFPPVEGTDTQVPFGMLRISLLSSTSEGDDDVNRTADVNGNTTVSVNGARVLRLSLRYDSLAPVTQFLAFDQLEKVRTRLGTATKWPARLKALSGCAVVDYGDTVRLPKTVDTRALSCAALDLSLRMPQADDVTDTGDGIITSAEGTGNVSDVVPNFPPETVLLP